MINKMSHSKSIFALLAIVAVVIVIAMFVTAAPDRSLAPERQVEQTKEATLQPLSTAELDAALSERILGNVSAPVKIAEHASLTCNHCAHFHINTFQQFKTDYIDTGKAYLVYSDFPLNEPAMRASMVARCLPQDQYFDFINMLFVAQEQWAFQDNYQGFLKAEALKRGLNEQAFESCVNSKELEEGIKKRIQAVQEQWRVNSTPSFVINNKTVIAGSYSYPDFADIINKELAAVQQPDPVNPASLTEGGNSTGIIDPVAPSSSQEEDATAVQPAEQPPQ